MAIKKKKTKKIADSERSSYIRNKLKSMPIEKYIKLIDNIEEKIENDTHTPQDVEIYLAYCSIDREDEEQEYFRKNGMMNRVY